MKNKIGHIIFLDKLVKLYKKQYLFQFKKETKTIKKKNAGERVPLVGEHWLRHWNTSIKLWFYRSITYCDGFISWSIVAKFQKRSGEVVRPKSVYSEVIGTPRKSAANRRWPLQSQFEIVESRPVKRAWSWPVKRASCRPMKRAWCSDNPARQQRNDKQSNKKEQSSHDLQGKNKHY